MIWFGYFIAFVLPVLFQAYLSWRDGFLTPAQMQAHGVTQGLPFIAHGGMWSDATVFAVVMATILHKYASQWPARQWGIALLIGTLMSAAMHWGVYIHGSLPEAHVRYGAVTSAGLVHFLYMAASLAILILFYICTKNLTPMVLCCVSLFLLLHMIVGTHVVLKLWANIEHPTWYPAQPIVDITTTVTITTIALILLFASIWALLNSDVR